MIRVGLVGYGLGGKAFHAPLIRACRRMELAAVMTSRELPGAVGTLAELIGRGGLDPRRSAGAVDLADARYGMLLVSLARSSASAGRRIAFPAASSTAG